jgi:large subunit ribosomal protein L5
MNPDREISLDKVVVNMGVGEGGEKLAKAERLLEQLTGQRPVRTISKGTNREWGLRKGIPIGCKVTLRGERGESHLKKAIWIRNSRLPSYSFDDYGGLSFGIPDHTDFGIRYDPAVGIFGMDISIALKRNGYRVARRRRAKRRIPQRHVVKREEAMEFMRERYGLEAVE